MYSFGNKRSYGEKAKQQATRERVVPTEIPSFHGKIDHDAYQEWETEMEYVFNCYYFTEAMKVKLAASGFCGYAIYWWEGIASTRRRNRQLQISSWFEMKVVMKKRFAPDYKQFGYVQDRPHKRRSQERYIRSRSTRDSTPIQDHTTWYQIMTSTSPSAHEYGIKRHEENIKDLIMQTKSKPEVDIRPINEAYKPDLEELNNESTCFRNSTHQGVTEKNNWSNIVPHEEVMQLTSRQTSTEPERDQRPPIEEFQSNQDEPSCNITCFGNLIQQRFTANWIHVKSHYGLKVIQLLNQEMLGLPYLEAHGFNHLQTRLWRPGEVHNHLREVYNHPGGSSIILEGLDLRTNPLKGGGDGVIRISLNFKDLKINHESSNHDYFAQPTSYDGHYGCVKTHLDHAESRDGRISLLSDRSELVRPPEQLQEAILVFDDPRHVSAHSQARNKAQEAQEYSKDELGLIMEKPKKMFTEQSPFWPIKLKDRPPWASTTY